jgi:hypothetical protein
MNIEAPQIVPSEKSTFHDCSFPMPAGQAERESQTWVMMLIGFAGLGYAGYRASRKTARAIQRA